MMMKHKFFSIRKQTLCVFVCVLILSCLIFGTIFAVRQVSLPRAQYTIVLDAGHGGKDGGAQGQFVDESALNLKYCLKLKDKLEKFGYKIVLTRKNMEGLYSPLAPNKKKSEMEKRKKIIDKSNADLVISIHMNSFPSSKARGAQVFYGDSNESGKFLAESVAQNLNEQIEFAKKTPKVGDYFVLNCTNKAGILIECGFLSNLDEEKLLIDDTYCDKFCYAVLCGIVKYFKFNQ